MLLSMFCWVIQTDCDKLLLSYLQVKVFLSWTICYQDHTRVGADTSQDIQLFGIGIQPEHCEIDIGSDGEVSLTPKENAR